jgi:hypothetical protein
MAHSVAKKVLYLGIILAIRRFTRPAPQLRRRLQRFISTAYNDLGHCFHRDAIIFDV